MALLVQKFGGTSVGSIDRIESVAERVISAHQQGNQVVVVVSAMDGETNRLLGLAKQVDEIPNPRELDVLLSAGEQISMSLLAMAICRRGVNAVSLTADQVRITTDDVYNNATIESVDAERITELLSTNNIVIVAGFQGRDKHNNITTLGRGGSDTTAVAIAGALNADECQIFTDVDGVYSVDPRLISDALHLDQINFDHMSEMARCGAKVLQLQSVEYARFHGVPLRVLSSFQEGEGTLVHFDAAVASCVVGVALQQAQSLLTINLSKLQVIEQLQLLSLSVWDIIACETGTQLVINRDDLARFKQVFQNGLINVEDVSIVSIIGDDLSTQINEFEEMLHKIGVNLHHAMRSEYCFSVLINEKDYPVVVEQCHKRFVIRPQNQDNPLYLAVS